MNIHKKIENSPEKVVTNGQRRKWSVEGPIELAKESEPVNDKPISTAFEIPITPPAKNSALKTPLRRPKVPKAPRPHSIHVDRSPSSQMSVRARRSSESNEQDENRPPVGILKTKTGARQ